MKASKKSKILLSLVLSAALTVTMCMPMSAFAATATWEAPTKAMNPDPNIVKVGAHAAATTAVHFLGGDLVTERATDYRAITEAADAQAQLQAGKERLELGVFGSSANSNPDPYLWNYFYNLNVAADPTIGSAAPQETTVYLSGVSNPAGADVGVVDELGTSATLWYRPDVLYGVNAQGGVSYDDLISQLPENTDEDTTNDYNPVQMPYAVSDIYALCDNMYNLADAIKASGKPGRYGDPEAIAENYEEFAKGIQLYVLSKIADGTIAKKKTVAVIDPWDTQGEGESMKFRVLTTKDAVGTTSSCRGAEYSEFTCYNIVEQLAPETIDNKAYVSAKDIAAKADVIIPWGGDNHSTQNASEESVRAQFAGAGVAETAIPPIYAVDATGIFSIRANSAENIFGVAALQGFIYPEVVNPIHCYMWLYENFYHISDKATLDKLVTANFENASLAAGIDRSTTGYSKKAIDSMISAGLAYYKANAAEVAADAAKLVLSDRAGKEANNVKITFINKTFKAKALKKKALPYKAVTLKNKKGAVSYYATFANAKSSKALKFKNGKITVKKGTKKGIYKVNVTVIDEGTNVYKSKTVQKTIKVTVK